jgi:Superfamily I DNA and RNA helicases
MVQIKDLLAYLQLVDNPQYSPALARAINVPSRGIGEKVSIFSIMAATLILAPYLYIDVW